MKWSTLLPLFLLPAAFAATKDKDAVRQQLIDLAAKGNGLIKLDSKTFDLLTLPNRDWSASIQFTALDRRRRCAHASTRHSLSYVAGY